MNAVDAPDDQATRVQLENICADPLFAQAERLKRLLRFTVNETLAGRGESLKEYTLGVQVFDRGATFDPATDPAVRVGVARLRSKLIEYYATAGRHDAVLITIPKGSYLPVFATTSTVVTRPRVSPVVWVAVATLLLTAGATIAIAYHYWPRAGDASVAVLPFVNMSGFPDAEYYGDGLSEEIINALSQVQGLRVAARTSTFQFKNQPRDVRDIGRRLGVSAVLEGSGRREGNALRITAQLIDTVNGYHLWSAAYDRSVDQIFTTQNEIADSVARTLRSALVSGSTPPLVRTATRNLAAYDLYLRGRYAWNRWTDVGFESAIAYYEKAIAADPAFAGAYAGLANCYSLLSIYGVMAPRDALTKAQDLAARSVALDHTLAEAHVAQGLVKYLFAKDREAAAAEMKRAIELNPGYADAHHFYSHILIIAGRLEDSVRELKTAQLLDPLSLVLRSDIGWTYYLSRQTGRAESVLTETLELDPDFGETLYDLGITEIQAGRFADAIPLLEKARRQTSTAQIVGALGYAYAKVGREADARRLATDLEASAATRYIAPSSVALIYAGLGDLDRAFPWLDRAVDARDPFVLLVDAESLLDPFRKDPRFSAIRGRIVSRN